MKSMRAALVLSLSLLCANAFAAGSAGGGGIGPKGPTSAPTPMTGPGSGVGRGDAKRNLTMSGTDAAKSGSRAVALETEDDQARERLAKEPWTTYIEAVQPGFIAIGAVRELPLGFRGGVASGMLLVAPTVLGELQTPSIHMGGLRLYAAAGGAWMYVPRVKLTGESGRAWGAGPKIGFEWRLPMRSSAAHGWHVGADAGVLFGDWSPIFGNRYRKSVPTFTPLRIGYYW